MFLSGCNSREKKKVQTTQTEVIPVAESAVKAEHKYKFGDQVPNDLVCMVNDAYMGEPQIPIPVDGKTYYGCCDMCVKTLSTEESSRMAIDPFSRNPVDKSRAYIVLQDQQGKVAYFESKENYLAHREKS